MGWLPALTGPDADWRGRDGLGAFAWLVVLAGLGWYVATGVPSVAEGVFVGLTIGDILAGNLAPFDGDTLNDLLGPTGLTVGSLVRLAAEGPTQRTLTFLTIGVIAVVYELLRD
ncbi:hypothetical protein [Haloarchaeobius iranensis]|uniref:Uncharacterized protein n=1 Tax=Haloarchaeobius iranensis TaxID=996166 RepID=A0A1G9YW27_9EURY|nr:hypothetical protein [Haloarchaeobius iranensis]SDN13360.1 hypothetical protein SAMN05192554_11673 [Haloarchaeobius iranensis]